MTRVRICCSCLTAPSAPGDTFCDPCRAAFDRGAFGPDSAGQMSWPAESATATSADGAAIAIHPDQLDLREASDEDAEREAYGRALSRAAEDGPAELSYFLNLQHDSEEA